MKRKKKNRVVVFFYQNFQTVVNSKSFVLFKKIIAKAEEWAIQRTGVQIVLCTCTAAGRPSTSSCDNVAQCIVDESGMCMEPEALIPITCSRARQIVLIGDHKQLQPVVKDDQARVLGLRKSLFERHSKKAIMLKLQYRMVSGLPFPVCLPFLSFCISLSLSLSLSVCLPVSLSVYLPHYMFACLSVCLSACLPACLIGCLFFSQAVHIYKGFLSICMLTKPCHIKQRQIKILFSQTLDIEVEGRSYHTASLGQS